MSDPVSEKKSYYVLFTIYPLKGVPYPRAYIVGKHPLDAYVEYKKNVMQIAIARRPFRVTLAFWSEIPLEMREKHKDTLFND